MKCPKGSEDEHCHPGIGSPEQNALYHSAPEDIFVDEGVGPHRAVLLNTLTSIEIKSIILKKGIILNNYWELWKEKKISRDGIPCLIVDYS